MGSALTADATPAACDTACRVRTCRKHRKTDHDLDHLYLVDPSLSLSEDAVRDLCRADPTQKLVPGVLDHARCTASPREHELNRADQEYIWPERSGA